MRAWGALVAVLSGVACGGSTEAPTADAALADAAAGADAAGSAADAAPPEVVPCEALSTTFGAAVPLQEATATFSQDFDVGAPWVPAKAIDGQDDSGWAISPAAGTTETPAQTAAFETVTDTPSFQTGTRFVVSLQHRFANEHGLGRFRIAVTTAGRSEFADGVDGISAAGDVGDPALWTVLRPRRMCATNSATMTLLPDTSVLVEDLDTNTMDYVLELDSSLSGVTGVRLETLNDPSLPRNGPGLQNANGNFVLSELVVRVGAQ